MDISYLPLINACLNGATVCLLVAGLIFIKKGNQKLHILCMFTALVLSALFLTSYLYYHFHHGITRFAAEGLPRKVYFFILISHTTLAILNLPLIITTVYQAAKGRFAKHKTIARWTWPIWVYVSSTGVLVYLMLYVWFPSL